MTSSKNVWIALIVVAVIAIGGYSFPKVQQIASNLGSVVGPDLLSPYFSVNEVRHEYRRTVLNTATTTPCALKSPAATSTLLFASLKITTSTTTATTWTISKALTGFATTTPLKTDYTLASGAQGTMNYVASSTISGVDNLDVVAPSQFIVWGVAGTAISGTSKLNGVCQAEFIVN